MHQTAIEQLFTLQDAAHRLALSVETLRAWRKQGRIKVIKLGDRVLIATSELQRLIAEGSGPATAMDELAQETDELKRGPAAIAKTVDTSQGKSSV